MIYLYFYKTKAHIFKKMNRFKILNKVVYALLAILIIYSSFGYLLLYFPVRTVIKYSVFKSIEKKEIAWDDLVILTFNIDDLKNQKYDLIWEKPDKEFRYNGQMYDIEDTRVEIDTIYYTCYNDEKENILDDLFALHIKNHKKDKTQNSTQRVILIGLYSEEIENGNLKFYDKNLINIPLLKKEALNLNPMEDIPTPPPRLIV